MTLTEKQEFVRELTASIRAHLLRDVEQVPDNWGGIELRFWVADVTREQSVGPNQGGALFRAAKRNYRKGVLRMGWGTAQTSLEAK